MPKVNKKKLDDYVNKLFRGEAKRYKDEQDRKNTLMGKIRDAYDLDKGKGKGRRVKTISEQGYKVTKACKNKCAVCGKPYENPVEFEIHHINGDRTRTITTNLILFCLTCHKKVHAGARVKLTDYKVRYKSKKPKSIWR